MRWSHLSTWYQRCFGIESHPTQTKKNFHRHRISLTATKLKKIIKTKVLRSNLTAIQTKKKFRQHEAY